MPILAWIKLSGSFWAQCPELRSAAIAQLLYHWRVLPGRPAIADEHVDIDAAVAALGGSPAVGRRLEALADASHSLGLFLEYVPYPLLGWLRADPVGTAEKLDRQLSEIVAFLRDRELLHMGGHFENMRTDGEQIYLTDFGLATSPRFEPSPVERAFADTMPTTTLDMPRCVWSTGW